MSYVGNNNPSSMAIVPIDSTLLKNISALGWSDLSTGYTYVLKKPVKNVSSMYIDNVIFPNTLYNVNDDQVSLYFHVDTDRDHPSILKITKIKIPESMYDNTSICNNFNTIPNNLNGFSISYGNLYNNRFSINYSNILAKVYGNKLLKFNSLSYDLGFQDTASGYLSVISDQLNIPDIVKTSYDASGTKISTTYTQSIEVIGGVNDTLILRNLNSGSFEFIIITLSPRIYNMYNIAYAINAELVRLGINTTDTLKCSYVKDNDKLLLYIGSSNVYQFFGSELAVTLKLCDSPIGSGKKATLTFLADFQVNYTPENPLQIIDYTHVSGSFVGAAGVIDTNIPVGVYSLSALCSWITNLIAERGGTLAFSYNLPSYYILKVYISGTSGSTDNYSVLNKCGFFRLLGCYQVFEVAVTGTLYMPLPPKLWTKNIYINSKHLTMLKTDSTHGFSDASNNIIGYFPYDSANPTIYNNTNKTTSIFSYKTDIEYLDIYFTDDDNKIINLNGGDVSLQLVLLS